MPRHRRVDIAGAVHHVISRGIERRAIFLDEADRNEFLDRLAKALEITGCRCYAWALLDNHFHLLIRTGERPLSDLMRRLLSGYAVYFNRRHQRHGYLYQNRYKSILCQEDSYLLELVRYIHLNPVRAGLVRSLEELNHFQWTGHSVLMGQIHRPWQASEEVLALFSLRHGEAVDGYRRFIMDGFSMGRRPELTEGGLKKSAGGWEGVKNLQRHGEPQRCDGRILGDGDFVERVLHAMEENLTQAQEMAKQGWDLKRLAEIVCHQYGLTTADLQRKGRSNAVSEAKAVICYLASHKLRITGSQLAQFFNISRPAISKAIVRGEKDGRQFALKLLN